MTSSDVYDRSAGRFVNVNIADRKVAGDVEMAALFRIADCNKRRISCRKTGAFWSRNINASCDVQSALRGAAVNVDCGTAVQ